MNAPNTNDILNSVASALDSAYNKDNLTNMLWPWVKRFVGLNTEALHQMGIKDELLVAANSNKVLNKTLMCQISALPFLSKTNYESFIQLLPEDVQQLWHELVWIDKLQHKEIEKEYNIKVYEIVEKPPYYPKGPTIKTEVLHQRFSILCTHQPSHFGWNNNFIFEIPLSLRRIIAKFYDKPASAELTPQPEAKAQHHFNGEAAIIQELSRVMTFYKQGQIAYTGKERPAHTTLVKMQRSLSIKEFFPDADNKKLRTLRTNFMAQLAHYIRKESGVKQPAPDIVKSFIRFIYPLVRLAPVTLPDLKGMGYIEDYDIYATETDFWELFKELPSQGWLPIENIRGHIKYNLLDLRPISEQLSRSKLYYEYEQELSNTRYVETKHYISAEQYHKAVTLPYISGCFFFFAALGLCELVYDTPEIDAMGTNCFSSWDGLRSVRRTALGDYVCGLTNTYDVSAFGGQKRITLSPETLMIVTDESDVSAAVILEAYAERTGATRFRTDSQIFLKNVKSKKELEAKIILFKQMIGNELPPNWEDFFKTLLQKINPFESPGEMHAYQVPMDNKPLIHLLAQDSVLKSLIIKAEGFIILVPKKNMAAFKRRLQEFGYLLT